MYTLHFGIVHSHDDEDGNPRIEDERLGLHATPGRVDPRNEVFHIRTEGELDYTVYIDQGSFEEWGEPTDWESLHLFVNLTRTPEAREVQHIRDAIEQYVTGGRFVDWAILTNEENWSQEDSLYLWHATSKRWPQVIELDLEP